MAKKKQTGKKPDLKTALTTKIEAASTILNKHKDKPRNDPKRMLAQKKLKRAQRRLGRLAVIEKKATEAKKA